MARGFFPFCLVFAWTACGPDEFTVDGSMETEATTSGSYESPDGMKPREGNDPEGGTDGAGPDGVAGESGEKDDDSGSGGDDGESHLGDDDPFDGGQRQGPRLSEVDTSLGNFNADLNVPAECEDLPESGCAHVVGLVNGSPVELTCEADSFTFAEGDLNCSGDGFSLWISIKAFSGAPPSSLNFTADSGVHPIGFSSEMPWFRSHEASSYLIQADYEQKGVRTAGVRYMLETEDAVHSFVGLVFALHFLPRPTCPSCPEVRLRGVVSAHTGRTP